MDEVRFYKLLEAFKLSYKTRYGKTLEEKQAEESRFDFVISNEEELLYFTLFSLKSGLTYDILGLVCGMNGSSAKKNQDIGLKVLKHALDKQGFMPARNINNKKDFEHIFKNVEELH